MKPKRGDSIIYSPYSSSAAGGGAGGGTKSSSIAADHTNMAAKRQKDRATGEAPRTKQNARTLFQNEQDDHGGDDESKSRTLTLNDSFTTAQESATTNGGGGGGSSSYYTQDSVFRSGGSVASHGSSVMSESTLVESIDENLMNLESFYSKLFGGGRGSSSKRQEEGPSSVPKKPVTRTYNLKGDDTASSHSHASASLVTENTKSQSNADFDSVFGRSEASSSFKTSDDTTADDTTTIGDTKSQSNVDYDDSVFGRSDASSSFKTSDNTTADDTTYSGTADDTMYSEIYGNSVRGGPVLESFEERDEPSSSSTTLEQSEVYSGRHRASQGVVHNIWDTISEGSEEKTSDSAGEEGSEADDTVGATSILRMATNKPAPVSINKPAPVSSTETTEVPPAAPLDRGTQATPKSRGSTSSNESVRTPNHSILKKPDKHSTTAPAAKPERDISKKVGSAAKMEVPRPPTTSILKMPTKAAAPGARQKPFTHRFSNLLGHRPKKADRQEVPDPLSTTPPPEEEPTEAMLPTPAANSSPRVRFSVELSKYLQTYDDYDNSTGGGGGGGEGSSCSGSGNDQELHQVCASSIPNFLSSWFQALASGDHINEACMSTTTRVDDGESDPHEEDPAQEEERDEMPSSNSAEDIVPPNRSSPTTNTSEARETISSSPHIADKDHKKKKEKGQNLDKKTVKKTNPKDSKKNEDKVTLRDLFSRKKETPTKVVHSSTKVKTSGSLIRGAAAASSSKVKIPASIPKGRATTAVKTTVVPPKKRKQLPLMQAFEMHAVPSSGTTQRRGANAAAHLSKAEARAVTESKRSEARFHRRRLHALREDSSRSSSEYEAHVAIPPSLS